MTITRPTSFAAAAVLGLCALALSGCGASPPLRYHALSEGPGVSESSVNGGAAMLVEMLPVAIPERLNRDEIVLNGPGGRLDVLDGERWAAPLADEIRQSVDDALWRRLRAADVYLAPVAPANSALPQYRLALRIERLDAQPGQGAVVEASWTARRLPQGAATVCRASFATPFAVGGTGNGADQAVAALTEATARMARSVASSLDRLNHGNIDPCATDSSP